MALSVTELDLFTFFEAEQTVLGPDMAWVCNDSVYRVTDGRLQLSFTVTPDSKGVRIILKTDDVLVYELNAGYVHDIRYVKDKLGEALDIQISKDES